MKQKDNDVVKGLRRAERELQFVRNGYDHPWVEMNRIHKNKKAYDRKKTGRVLIMILSVFIFLM
jgi:hypothetical protein